MIKREIIPEILKELKRAKKKFPSWPTHIVAQAGIVNEEAGELMKACLELKYERNGDTVKGIPATEHENAIRKEAIQTAAMAIWFLENFK